MANPPIVLVRDNKPSRISLRTSSPDGEPIDSQACLTLEYLPGSTVQLIGGIGRSGSFFGPPDGKEDFGEATGELCKGVSIGIDGLIDRVARIARMEVAVK